MRQTIDDIDLEILLSMIDGRIEVADLVAAGRLPASYLAERNTGLTDYLTDLSLIRR